MNKVILTGRLTKDPEVKTSQSGTKVARYGLAVNMGKDKTEFYNIVAFNKSAEHAEKWLKKGTLIILEGHLHNSSYEKDGQRITKLDIVADNQEFGESKKKDQDEVPEAWTEEGLPF